MKKTNVGEILIYSAMAGGLVVLAYYIYMAVKKSEALAQMHETDMYSTSGGAVNNPGNIRKSETVYQGEISSPSASFKSFKTIEYGYRAMIQLLRAYYRKGFTTLDAVINRYAPSEDNNHPESYISFVLANGLPRGYTKSTDLHSVIFSDAVIPMIYAMSKLEQGSTFAADIKMVRTAYNIV